MRKDFERVAELKEQMRSMLDKAEVEKRSLDEKEKETFAALKTEKELLEMKLERRNLDRSNPAFVSVNRPALFANVVDAIVNRRSLDEYGDAVNENGIKVEQRAEVITDASAVANLTPVVIGEIIEPLEKGLVIDKLGIKMQSDCVGELTFPTLAAIEASIMGENVSVTDTKLDIGKITATPKRISISVPVSRRAITQSNLALQNLVLKQMSLGVARVLNKWMFSGTKLANASDGVFVKAAPDATYTAANGIKFKDVVALETKVLDAGVDTTDGTAAYICSPNVYGALKSTPIESGSPRMIIENNIMNGYPVVVTNYMDADALGFGVFSYSAIGQFGDIDIVVDPYTEAKKNKVNFVLNTECDIVVARKEAFAVLKKAV